MLRLALLVTVLLMSLTLCSRPALAQDKDPVVDDIVLILSPEIGELLFERQSNRIRLGALTEFAVQTGGRAGFHSQFAKSNLEPQWVQVDLGKVTLIDAITLVPVSIVQESVLQNGYGFPQRFRVQVSVDPDFQQSSVVVDQTSADFPNPGKYPCQFNGLNVSGRYVRVTATKLAVAGLSPFFALGELMVISSDRNVASWRPVTTSSSYETAARGSKQYLVDESSILPLPTGRESSQTFGYLSAMAKSPSDVKWIEIDLGRSTTIDEVRLVPARPLDQPDIPGWGMPQSFQIGVANRPDFADEQLLCDFSSTQVRHESNHELVLPSDLRDAFSRGDSAPIDAVREPFPSSPLVGRYLRLTTSLLDTRHSPTFLSLSEIQVWSGDENVALGAKVVVSDVASRDAGRRWSPNFLVDGFTSGRKLISTVDWLSQIERRREIEQNLVDSDEKLRTAVSQFWLRARMLVIAVSLIAAALVAFIVWRQHHRLSLQTELLRNQIASDLHDDIGSNLGTIALLCQTFGVIGETAEVVQSSMSEIRNIALETGDAMRDILWLMRAKSTGLDEFIGRMRTITNRMVQGFEVEISAPENVAHIPVDLAWRRNVFLSFKETLYNAVRHSRGSKIVITVQVENGACEITVADNGTGVMNAPTDGGYGLGSLKKRLAMLDGTFEFTSVPGIGTTVRMRAPLVRSVMRRLRRIKTTDV